MFSLSMTFNSDNVTSHFPLAEAEYSVLPCTVHKFLEERAALVYLFMSYSTVTLFARFLG